MTTTRSINLAAALLAIALCVPYLRSAEPAATDKSPPAPAETMTRPTVPAYHALSTIIPDLTVDGVPLDKVIDYLRTISGANLVVDWKTLDSSANVSKDTPITLTLTDVSLRKLLAVVLEQASPQKKLIATVDSNVIEITTEEEADKRLYTIVYPVDVLVMPDNQVATPPPLGLTSTITTISSGGGGGSTSGASSGSLFSQPTSSTDANADTSQKRGEALVQLIITMIRPEIWHDNGGPATIKYFNGKLIVSAPASIQEEIGGPMPQNGRTIRTR